MPRNRRSGEKDGGLPSHRRSLGPAAVVAAACPRPDRIDATTWHLEGDDALNNMRTSIADTLKLVQVREPGLTGEIRGFRAGALYAHIYARDSATIAPAAQYLYDLPYLTRPVDEFLALQSSPFFDIWASAGIDEILSALREKVTGVARG